MKQAGRGAAFLSVSERLVATLREMVRIRGSCGCSLDQGFASADAGTAKIMRDFLMDIHGMEKCRCAVQDGDEREGHGSVLVRLATKLRGQTPFQKFERRHFFLVGERDCPIFGDKPVVIGIGQEEVENAAASLRGSARGLDGREEIQASAAAEQGEEIFFVGKTFVERRGCGARGAGDGAHGESMFAAPAPNAVGGIQDTAFETCIGLARHAATLPLFIALDYILYIVKDTMYK